MVMRVARIVGLMCALAVGALAQGTYTKIDYPGATATYPAGIKQAQEIVGSYQDSFGNHGFLSQDGFFTSLGYPGATISAASGINDSGQIVGYANPDGSSFVGFIYDIKERTFTAISYPGAIDTFPVAINNSGTVVGT